MSTDLSKAAPRPIYQLSGQQGNRFDLSCGYDDFWVRHFEITAIPSSVTIEYARLTLARMVEAVNSYDRLKQIEEKAVELAHRILNYWHDESRYEEHEEAARELLKLAGKE